MVDRSNRWWLVSLTAVAAAVLVFARLLWSDFIWDDHVVILRDPRVHDPQLWGQFLTEAYHSGVDKLYRPLVSLSYALQWQLHGPNAFAYHLVNLLAHAACAAMVAALARRWFGDGAALVAGLLFAGHPIYTEVVATVVYRTESFATLLALGAIWAATGPLSAGRIALAAGLWLAAMLCKESVITLGLLLPVFAWLAGRGEPARANPRLLRAFFAAMLAASAVYMIGRESILPMAWDRARLLDWTVNAVTVAEGLDRVLLPLVILGRYVAMYVTTVGLSVDHEGVLWPRVAMSDPYLWVGLAALAAWVTLVIQFWRRRFDRGLICLLAAGATYFVVSNAVVPIATQLGDRLIYAPSAFVAMLIGAGLARWRMGVVIGICVAMVLAGRSLDYARHWRNNRTITEYAAIHRPESVRPPMILAGMQKEAGDLEGALATLERARRDHPAYPPVWLLSAQFAREAGQHDLADALAAEADRLERVYPNNLVSRRQVMEPPANR